METTSSAPQPKPRLTSLDALRGFDVLLLLVLGLAHAFRRGPMSEFTTNLDFWNKALDQFDHVSWEGFSLCDLAMPLFLFMAGVAIPFSLARYLRREQGASYGRAWLRITRRVIVLWIFGMIVQGNLLSLSPERFKIFSNTLQAIAVGYFFSCIVYLYLPKATHLLIFVLLLLAFWACNKYIAFNGYGGGSYDPNGNLAYGIDLTVFGRFRDGVSISETGEVEIHEWYTYTWLLSSLTFVATTLSGMIAGETLYRTREKLAETSSSRAQWLAFALILVFGAVCLALGWVWGKAPESFYGYCPIVKHIWTPTMTLWSSGLSLVLLALFYLVYDIAKCPVLRLFFVVFGSNALAAYMLSHVLHFTQIADWLLYGTSQFVGIWYDTLLEFAALALIWLILFDLWRYRRYFRV